MQKSSTARTDDDSMQVETSTKSILDIPSHEVSFHAAEYAKKGYRRVLANWASDLLLARATEQKEVTLHMYEPLLNHAA